MCLPEDTEIIESMKQDIIDEFAKMLAETKSATKKKISTSCTTKKTLETLVVLVINAAP